MGHFDELSLAMLLIIVIIIDFPEPLAIGLGPINFIYLAYSIDWERWIRELRFDHQTYKNDGDEVEKHAEEQIKKTSSVAKII